MVKVALRMRKEPLTFALVGIYLACFLFLLHIFLYAINQSLDDFENLVCQKAYVKNIL